MGRVPALPALAVLVLSALPRAAAAGSRLLPTPELACDAGGQRVELGGYALTMTEGKAIPLVGEGANGGLVLLGAARWDRRAAPGPEEAPEVRTFNAFPVRAAVLLGDLAPTFCEQAPVAEVTGAEARTARRLADEATKRFRSSVATDVVDVAHLQLGSGPPQRGTDWVSWVPVLDASGGEAGTLIHLGTEDTAPGLLGAAPGAAAMAAVSAQQADVVIRVERAPLGDHVPAVVEATLRFVARGGGAALEIVDPYTASGGRGFHPDSVQVLDDAGAALPALYLATDRDGHAAGLVVLGAPLEPGRTYSLALTWRDAWPLVMSEDLSSLDARRVDDQGSELRQVFPVIGSALDWPYDLRVGVPERGGLSVVASGVTVRQWREDGVSWIETAEPEPSGERAVVAIGKWAELGLESTDGLPDVRVHMFAANKKALLGLALETARIISYYEQLLPPFPVRELDVYEAPASWYGYRWTASPGRVQLQRTIVYSGDESLFRVGQAHLEEELLAHEVAHQYWGSHVRPASRADKWISESLAQVYACVYLGAAFGQEACEARVSAWREHIEQPGGPKTLSLTTPTEGERWHLLAYEHGPSVLLGMLRPRIGDDAFFGATDRLATRYGGGRVSTDTLRAAFEETAGRSLVDFFQFWVLQGRLPAVELTWSGGEGAVQGTLTADQPGVFDVPVRVTTEGRAYEVWVEVRDGTGSFRVEVEPTGGTKVQLDPDGLILATRRRVSR